MSNWLITPEEAALDLKRAIDDVIEECRKDGVSNETIAKALGDYFALLGGFPLEREESA